jgi:hypothetical protein
VMLLETSMEGEVLLVKWIIIRKVQL